MTWNQRALQTFTWPLLFTPCLHLPPHHHTTCPPFFFATNHPHAPAPGCRYNSAVLRTHNLRITRAMVAVVTASSYAFTTRISRCALLFCRWLPYLFAHDYPTVTPIHCTTRQRPSALPFRVRYARLRYIPFSCLATVNPACPVPSTYPISVLYNIPTMPSIQSIPPSPIPWSGFYRACV